jgi:uncharacterized membrane protein HdeD (DUF308 family)
MLIPLANNWGILLLRGVLSIAFGVMALLMPSITLAALILLFGAYAFANGVLALITAISGRGRRGFWMLLLEGVAGIAASIIAFLYPGLTAITLLFVVAWWAILSGGMAIASAIVLRQELSGEWALGLSGVLSMIFGVLLLVQWQVGLVALVWIMGIYAIAAGVVLMPLAFRLRSLSHRPPQPTAHRHAHP